MEKQDHVEISVWNITKGTEEIMWTWNILKEDVGPKFRQHNKFYCFRGDLENHSETHDEICTCRQAGLLVGV